MKHFASFCAVLATVSGVFGAENAQAAQNAGSATAANISPHIGDVSHEGTMYSLYTYSEPGFRGKAARIEPHECTPIKDHGVKVKSLQFTGNNCCYFFPKDDCSNLHAGQRIVGNIPDVSVWGFPHGVGAVKCLSQAACSVLRHQVCDIDRHCGQYEEQSKCPFTPSCQAYDPVHPSDWSNFKLPPVAVDEESGYEYKANPVRETFFVTEDGETTNLQPASGVSPLDHHRAHLAAAGTKPPVPVAKPLERPKLLEPAQGGSDDYDHPVVNAKPGLPKKTAKKAGKAAKKESKQLAKEEKKKAKQDKKQAKKLAKIYDDEYYDYDDYYYEEPEEEMDY